MVLKDQFSLNWRYYTGISLEGNIVGRLGVLAEIRTWGHSKYEY
jgi:hypothetical protein